MLSHSQVYYVMYIVTLQVAFVLKALLDIMESAYL